MGQKASKPPIRILEPVPEEDTNNDSTKIDSVEEDEVEEGVDALGIAAVETNYPDPLPPETHTTFTKKDNVESDNTPLEIGDQSMEEHEDNERLNIYTPAPVGASFQKFYNKRSSTPLNLHNSYSVFRPPSSWMSPKLDLDETSQSVVRSLSRHELNLPKLSNLNLRLERHKSFLSKRELMLYEREKYEYKQFTTRFTQNVTSTRNQVMGPLSPREIISKKIEPTPLTITSDIIEADRLAETHKQHRAESYSSLIKDLLSEVTDDSLKVKVILAWISKQEIGKFKFGPKTPSSDTPNGYMHLMQDGQGTYPVFFTLLCRSAGIKCVIINGVSKGAHYEIGSDFTDDLHNSWNAVFVKEEWKLVHPLWVCKSLAGRRQAGWITLETDNKTNIDVKKESKGIEIQTLHDYFIFTNPDEFIYRNFPDDPRWQLLHEPLPVERFLEKSYLRPAFFINRFILLSDDKCVLHSESGKPCEIVIGYPKDRASNFVFDYALSMKLDEDLQEEDEDEVRESIMQNVKEFGKFVLVSKENECVTLEVRFSEKGTYMLRVYGGIHSEHINRPPWIMDVKLVCNDDIPIPNPLPFDAGLVGWGPGPVAETLGLFVPSHKASAIDVTNGIQLVIQFVLLKQIEVKVELHHCEIESESLKRYIRHELIESKDVIELRITVNSPGNGEFAMKVEVGTKKKELKNACNYIIHTREELPYEPFYTRKARRLLEDAMVINDITILEDAIATSEKHNVPDTDPLFVGARSKLEFLHCKKELRTALRVSRIDVAEHALYRTREAHLTVLFRKEIQRVEAHLKEVFSLDEGGWSSHVPEIDRVTIVELSHLRKPKQEVVQVVIAVYLLLGVEDEHLTNWNKLKLLLGEQEATLVEIARMEKYLDAEAFEFAFPSDAALDRVQDILDIYTEEDIRRIDNTAAAFYRWVKKIHAKLRKKMDKENMKSDQTEATSINRSIRTGRVTTTSKSVLKDAGADKATVENIFSPSLATMNASLTRDMMTDTNKLPISKSMVKNNASGKDTLRSALPKSSVTRNASLTRDRASVLSKYTKH